MGGILAAYKVLSIWVLLQARLIIKVQSQKSLIILNRTLASNKALDCLEARMITNRYKEQKWTKSPKKKQRP